MSDRETYIKRFEKSHAEIQEIVELAHGNPTIYPSWRMKEVLDHLTGWDDAVIASIKSVLAGDVPATPAARGIDVYNAETVSSRSTIPYEVTLREWKASRAELLRLIREMDEEKLHQPFTLPWGQRGSIETLMEIFTEHEEEHAQEIRAIITKEK